MVEGIETVGASRRTREDVLKKFGMLFQGGALFDSLPVWENIMFRYLQNNYIYTAVLRQIAKETLADVLLKNVCLISIRLNFLAGCRNGSVWPERLR